MSIGGQTGQHYVLIFHVLIFKKKYRVLSLCQRRILYFMNESHLCSFYVLVKCVKNFEKYLRFIQIHFSFCNAIAEYLEVVDIRIA